MAASNLRVCVFVLVPCEVLGDLSLRQCFRMYSNVEVYRSTWRSKYTEVDFSKMIINSVHGVTVAYRLYSGPYQFYVVVYMFAMDLCWLYVD